MEAIYFGSGGGWCGSGSPAVLADLENGLWGCDTPGGQNRNLTSLAFPFVTAMLKGGENGFALKGANAGGDANFTSRALKTFYDGPRPPGYQPMHKTGAIILGVGGDNISRRRKGQEAVLAQPMIPGMSIGIFYEGAMTAGYSADATDDAVQADIVAAGYGL